MEVTADDVKRLLYDMGELTHMKVIPKIKPSHGSCCTCQDCGYYHDMCVCCDNAIVIALDNLFNKEI